MLPKGFPTLVAGIPEQGEPSQRPLSKGPDGLGVTVQAIPMRGSAMHGTTGEASTGR